MSLRQTFLEGYLLRIRIIETVIQSGTRLRLEWRWQTWQCLGVCPIVLALVTWKLSDWSSHREKLRLPWREARLHPAEGKAWNATVMDDYQVCSRSGVEPAWAYRTTCVCRGWQNWGDRMTQDCWSPEDRELVQDVGHCALYTIRFSVHFFFWLYLCPGLSLLEEESK